MRDVDRHWQKGWQTDRNTNTNSRTKQTDRLTEKVIDRSRLRQYKGNIFFICWHFFFSARTAGWSYSNKILSVTCSDRPITKHQGSERLETARQHPLLSFIISGQVSVLSLSVFTSLFLTHWGAHSLSIPPLFFKVKVLCLSLIQSFSFLLLVFLECPSLSFQSFCLPHRLPLFLSYLPFYPIITLPMPRSHFLPTGSCDHYTSVVRGWWCSVKPEGFKVQVVILSLFLVSALSLAGIVMNKKIYVFTLAFLTQSLLLLFFTFRPTSSLVLFPFLCFHCISMFLFFSPHFLCVSVSPPPPLSLSPSVGCISSPLWRNENFLKFYQRSSAFSPNTLHAGYWRLQHGPLLCATVLCELYQGIKHKPATPHSTLSQLGTLHEELCQLTYSS